MDDKNMIYYKIHDGENVDTDKLIDFINTYGINYVDDVNVAMPAFINNMTFEQIDILMSNKPNILHKTTDGQLEPPFLYCIPDEKMIYALQKMLDYDDDFLFVTYKFGFNTNAHGDNCFTFLDFCKLLLEKDNWTKERYEKQMNIIIDMLENHLKKYHSLFDLMIPQIN